MSDNTSKKYPVAAPEIASMFKLDGSAPSHGDEHGHTTKHAAPEHLPAVHSEEHGHGSAAKHEAQHGSGHEAHGDHASKASDGFTVTNVVKTAAPYVIVFGVAIFVYFFFFSNFTFDTIFNRVPEVKTEKETLVEELYKQQRNDYERWIGTFYFDISDPKVIDPNTDNSGNGLTNFHKYLLNLNPKAYDTLGLGVPDSQALAQGVNPLSGSALTAAQKEVLEKYFDMELIMNKLTLAHMQRSQQAGQVAGVASSTQGAIIHNQSFADPNYVEIDTNVPGRLEIPSLKVSVPIIWTQDTANFEKDLQNGVVHYPGTALPSQVGTTYISGHSSNYAWAKGNYNQVFSKLGNLPDSASFKVTVTQKNGRTATLHYIVTGRQEFLPTDQAQFMNSGKSTVALSTCWPIGSTARRLVVFGDLSQVSRD